MIYQFVFLMVDFISHTRCLNSTSLREIQCRKAFMQVLRVGKYVHPDMKIGVSCW